MTRRSGLGRGLGALIPSDLGEDGDESASQLREIAVGEIQPNQYQPRDRFDEDALRSLSESIRALGVLQPILVRPGRDGGYELIAGERRWRAARRAGLTVVPAVVRSIEDDSSLEQALVENLHREDLNAIEEAAAYQQLINDFGLTQEQVALRVGRSRSAIANTLRLLQLPAAIQKHLVEGALSAGHARALLGSPDRSFQEELARQIVAEDLTVRQAEEAVRRRNQTSEADVHEPEHEPKSVPRVDVPAAGLVELEHLLSERLDTPVKVAMSAKRGRITIDFADLEDLERVFRLMVGDR
ncbi:MAG: ParB/RepB/Spo0J family partition protein [Actinomycetota bacterium]|nr:ParB/RepB/Spo0J family partition protein [Actinomycetota bacterium]